jgi:hypothetical protein
MASSLRLWEDHQNSVLLRKPIISIVLAEKISWIEYFTLAETGHLRMEGLVLVHRT